ncbi:MAG TPA: universal stress protein [Nitrososphaeraceae archaeon]|jgi:nucleotide-binding universal stress UspA family protein|nr:universal stress protein [Nitrososphaeraceae archaeon]
MKSLFSKIIVPMDGSDYSFKAAEYAIDIARRYESEITLISIVASRVRYGASSGIFGAIPPSYLKRYENEAKKWFNRVLVKVKNDGSKVKKIKTDVITTPLSIVSTILQYAQKDDADLIVLGTRGITGFKKMLVGSVASGVVAYAHCPVLVIR